MPKTAIPSTSKRLPLAIIIKENAKYLDDPKVRPLAKQFYAEIKALLDAMGFRVQFDPGKPTTIPKISAKVWIGHARGIDRLQYAPTGMQTLALTTLGHSKTYQVHDVTGYDPQHYQLSDGDRINLAKLHI